MAYESAKGDRARAEDFATERAGESEGAAGSPAGGGPGGSASPKGPPNLPLPTLGGKQFWGDELFFHQWRIQRNMITGHCRLLDARKVRRAWGTFDECRAKLEQIKANRKLPPMSGRGVVLLHGLLRSGGAMDKLATYLRNHGDYTVFNVTYPTTRASVAVHAQRLDGIIKQLDGIEELNFVGHSLGNVVIRHYLGGQGAATGESMATSRKCPDARIKRMVMLAPPNNGSRVAELFNRSQVLQIVIGESGSDLGRGWTELCGRLVTPSCEFGIIAGGLGNARGYNPLLGEDNDMVISVKTTRLAGAADFVVVPAIHTTIMNDPKVREYTLRFLEQGCFIAPDKRRPILAEAVG